MTKYDFKFLWIKVNNANGILELLLYGSVAIALVYLSACITLYAFTNLTGLLSFSWINGLYTLILLAMSHIIFSAGKGDK